VRRANVQSLDDGDSSECDFTTTELSEELGGEKRIESILEDRRTDRDSKDLTERSSESIEGALQKRQCVSCWVIQRQKREDSQRKVVERE